MIKTHKWTLILTSLITLLPIPVGILLRDQLLLAAEYESPFHFTVIGIPLIMLAVEWVCVLITRLDRSNRDRNRKVQGLVFWIIPVLSLFVSATTYALMLGIDFHMERVMLVLFGLLFLVLGNYLPKCRMNSTIGIKLPWTYTSEENWNATHRFGGRVWVIGGLLIALSAFLPGTWGIGVLIAAILILVTVPSVYSYRFYKKEKADGKTLRSPYAQVDPRHIKISMIAVAVILAGAALLMFTGDIEVLYGDTSFTIEASYHDDLTVSYDAIDSVEYRENNMPGSRTMGFGSARLLMGFFKNEEFGTYTRYTYTDPGSCVVLTMGERILVLSGKDGQSTKAIYEMLLSKIS